MTRFRSRLFALVERLNRIHKRFVFLLLDVVLAPLALFVTGMLVYAALLPFMALQQLWQAYLALPVIAALLSLSMGIPNIRLKAYESLAILRTGAFSALLAISLYVLCRAMGLYFPLVGVALFGVIYFLTSVGLRLAMLNLYLWVLRWGQRRWGLVI